MNHMGLSVLNVCYYWSYHPRREARIKHKAGARVTDVRLLRLVSPLSTAYSHANQSVVQ